MADEVMTKLRIALVVAYLIGMHTNLDVTYHGQLICTNILCGVFGLTLLYRNRHHIRTANIAFVVGMATISAISIVLCPKSETWAHGIRGMLQLSYSCVMATGLYLEVSQWSRQNISRVFGVLLIIMTIGPALEIHTPVRAISNAYRDSFYYKDIDSGQDVYDTGSDFGNARDLAISSHIRPSFFTQEPSYVALTFLISLIVWYKATSPHWSRDLIYVTALGIGVYAIHSPILVGAIPIWIVNCPFSTSRIWMIGIVAVVGGMVLGTLFAQRFDFSSDADDKSTAFRVTIPYILACRTLQEYPITGVGIGCVEVYDREIYHICLNAGASLDYLKTNTPVNTVLCNAFLVMIIYFGAVLTCLIVLLLGYQVAALGGSQFLYVGVAMSVMMNAQGAFVNPRLWTHFCILLAVSHVTCSPLRLGCVKPIAVHLLPQIRKCYEEAEAISPTV